MRLRLFNGGVTTINVDMLAGAADPETGLFTIIVNGSPGQAGTLTLEAKEATRLIDMLRPKKD